MQGHDDGIKLTRRELLIAGATSVAASALPGASALAAEATAPEAVKAPVMSKVSFTVNGKAQALEVDTRTTLLARCARTCA